MSFDVDWLMLGVYVGPMRPTKHCDAQSLRVCNEIVSKT